MRHRLASTALFTLMATCATPAVCLPAVPDHFREADAEALAPLPSADHWWAIFQDAELDRLIAAAHASNPSLDQSLARVAQARARSRSSDAARLPQITAGASGSRQTGPLINAAGGGGELYTASASLSYEVDLFGRLAKAGKAARRELDASESAHAAARLMVESEVARSYLRIRLLDDEEALLLRAADGYARTLALAESNLAAGLVPAMQVDLIRTEAADWRNALLSVQRERAEQEHALAALVGDNASTFRLDKDIAPTAIPVVPAGLPSAMLQRRPDIHAAEATMEAARLRVGVAKASWFPSFALTGSEGYASPAFGDLFRSVAQTGGISLLAMLPIFDGGRQKARVKGAEADYQLAAASWRETVLQSFREVEDRLVGLRTLADQARETDTAATAATRAAERASQMQAAGLISVLDRLETERRAISEARAQLHLRAARYDATIGLVRALGGGWDGNGSKVAMQP